MQHLSEHYRWWQTGIIYQIYPRSFQDSNGDGIGDLRGIIQRLDYLKWLGVNAIWIAPFFKSPMADFGYDIADYNDIDPIFGTIENFDELIAAVHQRGLKLILDLVPNHTSDQHPWFLESKSSRDNPKRDWYIWQDGHPDTPPNNWRAAFGGSGWEWDAATEQFYFHSFLKEQPDLNWRNPEVRNAIYQVMRFWLDKGVDGFRVDVLWHLIKDIQLRDNPPNPDYEPHMATYDELLPVFSTDQPEVHEIIKEMRKVTEEYPDRMIIGEVYLPLDKLMSYYGSQNDGAHLPFNFQLIFLPWEAQKLALAIDEYESFLPTNAWPNWVLGNHDQVRVASRIGNDQLRNAALLLLTLRGTPTIYYGEEIGMTDVPIPKSQIRDPAGINMPERKLSRDPARTPMQWDDTTNAGFSTVDPWLPISRSFLQTNAKRQIEDPNSILWLYKKLIALRQNEPALMIGSYRTLHHDLQVIAFIREWEGHDSFVTILNLTHRSYVWEDTEIKIEGVVEVATHLALEGKTIDGPFVLYGDEGVVIRLKNKLADDRSKIYYRGQMPL